MKISALLFCVCALIASAEEVTITKSTMLKAEHSAVSLKAGTVVELLSREAETTYGKAVEKARENAGKHEKNLVKPADEVTEK